MSEPDCNELFRLMRQHARSAVELADEADRLCTVPDDLLVNWGAELDRAMRYACELDWRITETGELPDDWRRRWRTILRSNSWQAMVKHLM